MALKINEKLRFTFPIQRPRGQIWVHATPISREVFSAHYLVLGQAMSKLMRADLGTAMVLQMAAIALEDVAREQEVWEDDPKTEFVGVQTSLMAEIRRLTTVMLPMTRGQIEDDKPPRVDGWQSVPLDEVLKTGLLDQEEAAEVESILVFFTAVSWVWKRSEGETLLKSAGALFGGQLSSLNSTAFRDSLPTSKETETTSQQTTTLSVPA